MAIAPSKLGRYVYELLGSTDEVRVERLRGAGLVKARALDDDLIAAFRKAIAEHEALPEGVRQFNSPNERVRVFLGPCLSRKGRSWAVPLDSLNLPDDGGRSPWWKFWA